MIVGGSVGLSLLLIVILILAGRSGTDASAATSAIRTAGTQEHLGKEPVGKDSPASPEIYPIPPEAVAAEAPARSALARSKGSAAIPSTYGATDAEKPLNQRAKPARDRFAARRIAATPRAPGIVNRGSGVASGSARSASPFVSPHTGEPATPSDALTTEPKKRVPLVEDQPRVHILD